MISARTVENKAVCSCPLCLRQRVACDNIERGIHGISEHARFCKEVVRRPMKFCKIARKLVPVTECENDETDNIVEVLEQENAV